MPDASREEARRTLGVVAGEISKEIVRLMSRYTGRGPTKARTTINTNVVVVLLDDALTKAEQNLAAAGEEESIVVMRRTFHQLMRDEASGIVERVTGRRVISFMSDVDPEGNRACQVFALEPRPEMGLAATAEAGPQGS